MSNKILQSNELKVAIRESGSNPVDRLVGFANTLANWSIDPDKYEDMRKLSMQFDAEDIDVLRSLIFNEVKSLKYLNADEATEHILFLLIGALKFDPKQDKLPNAWSLASLSIQSLLKKKNKANVYKYLLYSLIYLTIGMVIWIISNKHIIVQNSQPDGTTYIDFVPLSELVPSPYIPSHFYSLKAQMEKTTCQFPQAAMLPPEQRAAFLNFINTGSIALPELSNLQLALTRVHCEYVPLISRLSPSR